jgi:beta-galactosidase
MSIRTFTHNDSDFLLDGKPIQLRSGELHYSRIPREYWRDRLLKAKALGLNSICIYMFWNVHEPVSGTFDFSGQQDVATFVKIAQELGLWVIVRPGPYCCAEWDFGGLPWWLLKNSDLRLRCLDDSFWPFAKRYLQRVGEELSPLTISRGGPIIMVQVENEYGSYGNDKPYLQEIRKTLRESGFDTLLFTSDASDPASLAAGTLDGCLAVANFGSKAELHMNNLRNWQPNGPLMNGEFWCGWFDEFGKPRNGSDSVECVKDIEWMLDNNVSFNVYMLHGGTNFGYSAGANQYDYHAPYVSSYDYWAFIDESGRPTAKYHAAREAIANRLKGETLPELPPPTKIIEIPQFELTESAAVFENLPEAKHVSQPRSMEHFDQPHGYILYRTTIDGLGGGKLKFDARDLAIVYLNGKRIGSTWRTLHQDTVEIPATHGKAQIDILVAALGRTNYGPKMIDRKGIPDRVQLDLRTLMHWDVFNLPFDSAQQNQFKFGKSDQKGPAIHRGKFALKEVGDTFLDLRDWNFGSVWVNGHHLGRFWQIGPQQTLYLPGCWLKEGENEIVVLDLESDGRKSLRGLTEPILNEIHPLEQ